MEYHIQPDLVQRFKAKSLQMKAKYQGKEGDFILAFQIPSFYISLMFNEKIMSN